MACGARGPILVGGGQPATAQSLVIELRRLGRRAVWADTRESAYAAVEALQFELIVVLLDRDEDWTLCDQLLAAAACPVVVGTPLLARDRRYRAEAFGRGVIAYMCPPYTRQRLRDMIRRVAEGETAVELVTGSHFCERDR